jgi:hypothetical protein
MVVIRWYHKNIAVMESNQFLHRQNQAPETTSSGNWLLAVTHNHVCYGRWIVYLIAALVDGHQSIHGYIYYV